ncbi:uncharacterized protein LOC131955129 [Physella acuta]|uniref:uncharacterized protein LOC131955129 n=1 Tax=Physella acuta TaxID=109671 RepID=UPI0027DAD3FA|nr:uncharacterized protein LOC131955129 [Physella acuta]
MTETISSQVREDRIPEQKVFDDLVFPLVLANDTNVLDPIQTAKQACDWLASQKANIESQLLKHGAILFRGFPLQSAQDFDDFVTAYGLESLSYVGGAAPRVKVTENVFTANEAPPEKRIPFHHEMAQVPVSPSILFFYCDIAPPCGGQTPLALSNVIYRSMLEKHPQFVRDLEEKKVQYTRVLPEFDDPDTPIGRGWRSTYQTDDRGVAEVRCREQGTSFEWLPDGCLKTVTAVLPAIRVDARTGKKMWFNSIIAAYRGWQDSRNSSQKAVTFSDGTYMPPHVMDDLDQIFEEAAVDVTWQKGDVILVDNRQALHARREFTPPRRILAALGK